MYMTPINVLFHIDLFVVARGTDEEVRWLDLTPDGWTFYLSSRL